MLDRPVVVVLPGVMGSHLSVNGKDRVWFDPLDIATEVEIMRQEAQVLGVETPDGPVAVDIPDYLADVVATFSHLARSSSCSSAPTRTRTSG